MCESQIAECVFVAQFRRVFLQDRQITDSVKRNSQRQAQAKQPGTRGQSFPSHKRLKDEAALRNSETEIQPCKSQDPLRLGIRVCTLCKQDINRERPLPLRCATDSR